MPPAKPEVHTSLKARSLSETHRSVRNNVIAHAARGSALVSPLELFNCNRTQDLLGESQNSHRQKQASEATACYPEAIDGRPVRAGRKREPGVNPGLPRSGNRNEHRTMALTE